MGVSRAPADEGLDAHQQRHWYDRLMLLCDGVFAIAITLQAADIRAPRDWSGDWASLHLGAQLNVYAMSFLVISIFWLVHRRFMAMIRSVDPPMTILTLMMLGLVALLPAATRLINGYTNYMSSRMVYAGLVVLIGLAIGMLWTYAAFVGKVVSPEVSLRQRWYMLFLVVFTPPFFLSLTFTIPQSAPYGVVPLFLAGLFLIGWPMRLWVLRRLEGPRPIGRSKHELAPIDVD
jgi:uncharacterized membrane protein